MACCQTFSGIVQDCEHNVGGIKRAWIACYDSVTGKTVTNNQISAITFTAGAFKEFEFKKQTGNVVESFQSENGSNYYEQTITLQFSKRETAKRIEINSLALSDLVVIIEDNNGLYWYYGFDNYVSLATDESETGTAFSDFNGYNITLVGTDYQLAYEITADAMAPIIASAA